MRPDFQNRKLDSPPGSGLFLAHILQRILTSMNREMVSMTTHRIREYHDSDAADVAVLFNESNDAWPGGFTGGKDLTAEDIRRWVDQIDAIAVFVSEADGHPRGYCSLLRSITEDRDSAYVELLGVTPAYHGTGMGRDLLRASIDRAVETGIRRVDLHTWAGNLRAVPLYKKTGFMWVPETKVLMQNYLPMILSIPFVQLFFDGADWYGSIERELTLEEDLEKWHDMKVYSYRFRGKTKEVLVKIHALAREIVSFADETIRIELLPAGEKPLKGRILAMTLEMENRTGIKEMVSIRGFSRNGITCDHTETLELDRSVRVQVPFTIGHRTAKGSNYDFHPTAGVQVTVGGKSISLAIGLETKPFVTVGCAPRHPVVAPGRDTGINIELTNNTEGVITGALLIPEDIADSLQCPEPAFELPKGGKKSLATTVRTGKSFVFPAKVEYRHRGSSGVTDPVDIPIVACDPYMHTSLAYTDPEFYSRNAKITKDGLLILSKSRGAVSRFIDPGRDRELFVINPTSFGPPYEPSAMEYSVYDQIVRNDAVTMNAPVDKNSNLDYHQKVTLIGGGWLSLEHRIVNTGKEDTPMGMKLSLKPATFCGSIRFCHGQRVISGMMVEDGYPAPDEIPRKRELLDEGWIAIEDSSAVWGMVFGDDVQTIDHGWNGYTFEFTFEKIPSDGEVTTQTVYLYYGPGTHRDVRAGWLRLAQGSFGGKAEPKLSDLRELHTVPTVPVMTDRTAEFDVCFSNYRLVPASGEIRLATDGGITLSEERIPFQQIKKNEPFSKRVCITRDEKSAGASSIHMHLECDAGMRKKNVLVLETDPTSGVRIDRTGDEFVISNGLVTMRADPGWGGGIHSLRSLEKEWLRSPYPDRTACFSWYNPWRGGIKSVLMPEDKWSDFSYREDWEITDCGETVGNMRFAGIETRASLSKNRDLEGAEVTMKFLLSEGHRILRIVHTVKNTTDISYYAKGGIEVFLNIHPANRTRQHFDYGNEHVRIAGPFEGFHPTTGWIITENEENHECMLAVMCSSGRTFSLSESLWVADHGTQYGQHLLSDLTVKLKPHTTRRVEYYIVPCPDADTAFLLRSLDRLGLSHFTPDMT
jgi:GNAT superfamily N-acetyltransferase